MKMRGLISRHFQGRGGSMMDTISIGELAELTREYINRFKGTNLPAGEIEKIAKAYKEKPGAIKYR